MKEQSGHITSKVILGYILLITIAVCSVAYIYNIVEKVAEEDEPDHQARRKVYLVTNTLSLLYESEALGQLVGMPQNEFRHFNRTLNKAHNNMDSLRTLVTDSMQLLKIDTIDILLERKRWNTRRLLETWQEANTERLYTENIEKIIAVRDTIVNEVQVQERVEVKQDTVVVPRKKRGFFKRLADVFSPGKEDTSIVVNTTREIVTDTLVNAYNPTDTIVSVLKSIQDSVAWQRQQLMDQLLERASNLRYNNSVITREINQMLRNIEEEEMEASLERVYKKQVLLRETSHLIAGIAIVSVVIAFLFLFFISRDISRSKYYRMQLEIEREAIKRENDRLKLEQIGKELAELKEQEKSYKAKWQNEKTLVNKIQQNKVEIENLKFEADKAEREGDYGKVAEIRYGKLQALNQEIEETQQKLHEMQGDKAMIKEEVDAEDIADVVSRWTGIPVSKMLQSEKEKLLHLEDELHQRVIGQNEAIEAVADAVRRSRAGLQDPKRPIGSFLFLGTTGVGKTELAKALAEFLFDDETMMTRIDMSEYQEKHSVSRLVGAPPGYVGYDEGGQLTEAVRRKPYSVVLFDEIEKAHPDVFNILLQVLDDGRLTDNKGRTVNFKNTIIIMTSNMGSGYIQSQMEKLNGSNKEEIVEETKKEVMNMLKKTIRPEFLNRIDETIMFLPLTEKEIKQIVVLQIKSVQKMLSGNGVELVLTDAAIDFLANAGYDPEFGARPVKRAIQHYLLNDLSKKLLSQEVDRSKPITVDINATKDELDFRN